jgi:L-ribulokinase
MYKFIIFVGLREACALGAAMCAATAAGAYPNVEVARDAMNSGFAFEYQPIPENVKVYEELYKDYISFGEFIESYEQNN